jgi:hypothetical protein
MVEQFTGQVQILDSDSEEVTIALSGDHAGIVAGGSGQDGDLILTDSDGNQRLWIDGQTGNILLKNAAGDFILRVVGDEGDITVYRRIDGSQRPVMGFDASSAALYLGSEGQAGDILVRNSEGDIVFKVRGHQGDIIVHRRIDGVLREVMKFDAFQAALYIGAEGNAGDIIVRDGSGNERIRLDGNAGDIRLQGADCAEEFDVVGFDTIDPGTVLVIGDDGKLRPCEKPYDKRVAGVASGGNGSNPGIILDSNPAQERRVPIALNGKVYCKVDAQISPIEIGDLLTASPVLGHAMKAEDPQKAFGAVIGKALRGLEEGRELIPILVSLQ